MKRCIFNATFYPAVFFLLAGSIYRLGYTIPPLPGEPGYRMYQFGTLTMGISVGLMVVIPNLALEYLKWLDETSDTHVE